MDQLNQTINNRNLAENENDANELQWEQNHADISNFILNHIREHGSMPGKILIAQATGLSRKTVYKHLRTYSETAFKQTAADSFKLATEHLLSNLLKQALKGNLRAAKIFLQQVNTITPVSKQPDGVQNNFVQINKTIINQQLIQQLKPEQLKLIEDIIAKETGD